MIGQSPDEEFVGSVVNRLVYEFRFWRCRIGAYWPCHRRHRRERVVAFTPIQHVDAVEVQRGRGDFHGGEFEKCESSLAIDVDGYDGIVVGFMVLAMGVDGIEYDGITNGVAKEVVHLSLRDWRSGGCRRLGS